MLLRPDHLDVGIAAEIGIQQERHREGRTHSHLALDADPPAVQFDDAFRKGQSDADPGVLRVGLVVVEAFENRREEFLLDAVARIGHLHHGLRIVRRERHRDPSAPVGVFESVAYQIIKDFLQLHRVERHFQPLHPGFVAQLHLADAAVLLEGAAHVGQIGHQILPAHFQGHVSLLLLAEVDQFVDQIAQPQGVAADAHQIAFEHPRHLLPRQQVQLALDQRQRRAEFVRDVGEEDQLPLRDALLLFAGHALHRQRLFQLLFRIVVADDPRRDEHDQQHVENVGRNAGVERRIDPDAEFDTPSAVEQFGRTALHGQPVVPRREVHVADDAPRQRTPRLVVADQFVLIVAEVEIHGVVGPESDVHDAISVPQRDRLRVGHRPVQNTGPVAGPHGPLVHRERREEELRRTSGTDQVPPGERHDAIDAARQHLVAPAAPQTAVFERQQRESVADVEILAAEAVCIDDRQSGVGSEDHQPRRGLRNGAHVVARNAARGPVVGHELLPLAVEQQRPAAGRSDPRPPAVVAEQRSHHVLLHHAVEIELVNARLVAAVNPEIHLPRHHVEPSVAAAQHVEHPLLVQDAFRAARPHVDPVNSGVSPGIDRIAFARKAVDDLDVLRSAALVGDFQPFETPRRDVVDADAAHEHPQPQLIASGVVADALDIVARDAAVAHVEEAAPAARAVVEIESLVRGPGPNVAAAVERHVGDDGPRRVPALDRDHAEQRFVGMEIGDSRIERPEPDRTPAVAHDALHREVAHAVKRVVRTSEVVEAVRRGVVAVQPEHHADPQPALVVLADAAHVVVSQPLGVPGIVDETPHAAPGVETVEPLAAGADPQIAAAVLEQAADLRSRRQDALRRTAFVEAVEPRMKRPDIEHAPGRAGQRRDLAHRGQQQLAALPVGRGDHDAVPGSGIDPASTDRRGRDRTAVEQRIGEERPESLPPQVVFDDVAKLVKIDQSVLLAVDALDVHRAEEFRGTLRHERLLGLQSAIADHAADARGPYRAVFVLIKRGHVGLVESLADA